MKAVRDLLDELEKIDGRIDLGRNNKEEKLIKSYIGQDDVEGQDRLPPWGT